VVRVSPRSFKPHSTNAETTSSVNSDLREVTSLKLPIFEAKPNSLQMLLSNNLALAGRCLVFCGLPFANLACFQTSNSLISERSGSGSSSARTRYAVLRGAGSSLGRRRLRPAFVTALRKFHFPERTVLY